MPTVRPDGADDPATWDRAADTFDQLADHGLREPATRRAWESLLLPLLGTAPRSVADLGCGTGTLAGLLAEAGHGVIAVDFSRAMLTVAGAKAQAPHRALLYVQGDVGDPPLAASRYDVVLCRHVLWALPDADAALAAWTRLLRPGGMLLLIEGRWRGGVGLTADHCSTLVHSHRQHTEIRPLNDRALWGGPIEDERYLLISR
jgi:ubiquinone/menaquinone biosynthesis C-methylase UbiE